MKTLPNIWGRGAIVAYSGLEGTTTFDDSMFGQLMEEHVGITLDDGAAELYLRLLGIPWIMEIDFSLVCSDLIEGALDYDHAFKLLFVNQNTLVGYAPAGKALPIFHADLGKERAIEGGKAYECEKGWYAFITEEKDGRTYFAVSRSKNLDEAVKDAKEALQSDIEAIADKYRAYLENVPELQHATEDEKMTFAKCFSVMKSQVHTAEGVFKTRWTTPERTPHKKCWLWDSVFHSIGNVYLEPELAYETLHAIIDMQREEGFIPHMSFPNGKTSSVTQPPLIAWGVYRLYEKTGRRDWMEIFYEGIKAHLNWVMENRDLNHNHLYEWEVTYTDPTCHCGESGMDNSPRFDIARVMDAIDFSCYMANEMRHMEKLAQVLGLEEDAKEYASLYTLISERINEELYDEEDGRYYDRDTTTGEFCKISTPAGLLPLFAGVCPPERAKRLVEDICNPNTFNTPMPIPTVSLDDPEHCIDYWRGMVWINYNYMVQQGLRDYGYIEEANHVADATIAGIAKWYMKEGSIFEIYDPQNVLCPSDLERKGKVIKPREYFARLLPVRDFGWSSTLYVAMVMEREERKPLSY